MNRIAAEGVFDTISDLRHRKTRKHEEQLTATEVTSDVVIQKWENVESALADKEGALPKNANPISLGARADVLFLNGKCINNPGQVLHEMARLEKLGAAMAQSLLPDTLKIYRQVESLYTLALTDTPAAATALETLLSNGYPTAFQKVASIQAKDEKGQTIERSGKYMGDWEIVFDYYSHPRIKNPDVVVERNRSNVEGVEFTPYDKHQVQAAAKVVKAIVKHLQAYEKHSRSDAVQHFWKANYDYFGAHKERYGQAQTLFSILVKSCVHQRHQIASDIVRCLNIACYTLGRLCETSVRRMD